MLLLHHLSIDSFEIWYAATYEGPSSSNELKFANFQFLNFLDFFLNFDLNRYSSFISQEICLKFCTWLLVAIINNEIEPELAIFHF